MDSAWLGRGGGGSAHSSLKDSYKDGGAKLLLVHGAIIMDGSLVVSGWIREHSFTTRVRQINRNFHPRRSVGIRWRESNVRPEPVLGQSCAQQDIGVETPAWPCNWLAQ